MEVLLIIGMILITLLILQYMFIDLIDKAGVFKDVDPRIKKILMVPFNLYIRIFLFAIKKKK